MQVVQSAVQAPNTPEFRRWFGASKVVDRRGKALQVYHGSYNDFDVFNSKGVFGVSGVAGWFSEDPELLVRKDYYNKGAHGVMGVTYPVFLSVQNPAVLRTLDMDEPTTMYDALRDAKLLDYASKVPAQSLKDRAGWDVVNSPTFVAAAKRAGHDGIKVREGGVWTWAIFRPQQVKSATGNPGSFDAKNPSMVDRPRTPVPVLRAFRALRDTVGSVVNAADYRPFLFGRQTSADPLYGTNAHRVLTNTEFAWVELLKPAETDNFFGFDWDRLHGYLRTVGKMLASKEIVAETGEPAIAKRLRKGAAVVVQVPVFNRAQWLCRQIMVELDRVQQARQHWQELDQMVKSKDWSQRAAEFVAGPGNKPLPYKP